MRCHLLPVQAHGEEQQLLLGNVVRAPWWHPDLGSAYVVSQYQLHSPGSFHGCSLRLLHVLLLKKPLFSIEGPKLSLSLPLISCGTLSRSLPSSKSQFPLLYNGYICESTITDNKIHSNLLTQKGLSYGVRITFRIIEMAR